MKLEPTHFTPVAESKLDIPYADLTEINISRWDDGPEEQARLAEELRDAMTTDGFLVLTGHALSEADISRQVDIGYTVIEETSLEEKCRLQGHMDKDGVYRGFKLRQYYEMQNGVKDQIEQFNWQRDMKTQEFPAVMQPFLEETKEFCRIVHENILFKVFRLFALALAIPSDTFVAMHRYEALDDAWFRYMTFYDEHDPEDEKKIGGVWLKGHQDHGAVTMVFSQPMASLQVRDDQGVWRYTRHTPGGIIINCGIMMEWWTGGYFKAANHRVVAPPADQRNHIRCGVFYFSIPNDQVRPNLLTQSPVLRDAGVKAHFEHDKTITAREFSRARVAKVGKSNVYKQDWGEGQRLVEVIAGVEVPHFG
ncbi:Clavaminate synthase-like protein [Kockovaella imperatae]|uniref:Clavaminate synthase-like protein n=1 Tax=Kockovaella imperatae TaxID=4999 RepID=A0A1Y1UNZ8_9TREE|nr:Clavaminate synthase-like protein [Kockovaella imperatae]ORX39267.1 Clavaminate synthase-like protein [Kockovaella imperatae]